MVVSGDKKAGKDYIEGLTLLSSMRLCSNVPAQAVIQTALGGYQSINDLIAPKGRLFKQREMCMDMLAKIPGVSCVRPKAAFYVFPKSTIKNSTSRTTRNSSSTFSTRKKCCSCREKDLTGPIPTISGSCFCPQSTSSRNRSNDWEIS